MTDEELQTLNAALDAAARGGYFEDRRQTSWERDVCELLGWADFPHDSLKWLLVTRHNYYVPTVFPK